MGCATSKQKNRKLCKNCQAPYIPVRRSYSMHSHQKEEESFNLVAIKSSSTLGSFKLDKKSFIIKEDEDEDEEKDEVFSIQKKEEFVMGMVEAKTWSKMIDERIPKIVPITPTRTPPGEPETINAWELMEGLEEDISPLVLKPSLNQIPSFSIIQDYPTPKEKENGEESIIKALWLEDESNDTSIASEFDPEVIASFRKALEELPPTNPFHMKPINQVEKDDDKTHKLIVYFTSLRGVRKTYEDCCDVRSILKGLGVKIDERDVSMHSRFKDELKELLLLSGEGFFTLPKVFIDKTCIGGAEEIRRMHEEGRLQKAVESCVTVDDGGGGIGSVCESCGDVRFVPCDTCSGSCKIYYEGDYDDDDDEEELEESNGGFQPCPDCNENGLIRCRLCCD